MSKTLEERIEALEALAGITPETDCPEGYREIGPDEVLQECDLWKMAHGDGSLFNTVNAGKRVSEITPYSQKRYFRKLAEPAATAEPDPQDCPDGCLPFDLAKAIAGHPVRTRDGESAKFLEVYQPSVSPVRFVIAGTTTTHSEYGEYVGNGIKSDLDLFLVAPKPSPREIVEQMLKDEAKKGYIAGNDFRTGYYTALQDVVAGLKAIESRND